MVGIGSGVVAWSAPRGQVPLPGRDATPEQVVTAYVDAVRVRDFETANAIDARPEPDLGRFSHPLTMTDIEILSERRVGGAAYVSFVADYKHSDASLTDGQRWGFVLERGSDDRWHITDAGVA